MAYCKDQKEKEWYLYDDNKVTKLSQERKKEEIINSNSYLLFYRRKEKGEPKKNKY